MTAKIPAILRRWHVLSNHFSVNYIAAQSEVEYDDTTVKGVTAKLKYVLDHYELPTSRKVTAEESEKFIALRELKQLQVPPASRSVRLVVFQWQWLFRKQPT